MKRGGPRGGQRNPKKGVQREGAGAQKGLRGSPEESWAGGGGRRKILGGGGVAPAGSRAPGHNLHSLRSCLACYLCRCWTHNGQKPAHTIRFFLSQGWPVSVPPSQIPPQKACVGSVPGKRRIHLFSVGQNGSLRMGTKKFMSKKRCAFSVQSQGQEHCTLSSHQGMDLCLRLSVTSVMSGCLQRHIVASYICLHVGLSARQYVHASVES